MTFRSTTGAALCTATVTSAGSGAGTATCAASLATGAHAVITTLAGPNHQAIADVSAVVVGRTASNAFACW